MTIFFDMDGTFVDLYGVDNWLSYLLDSNPYPYIAAKPLINLSLFARELHKAQKRGYKIGIISWLSKNGSNEYNNAVSAAKIEWLNKHLPSVQWDEIHILEYGTPKSSAGIGYLFDDEEQNRIDWGDGAFNIENLITTLRSL